MIFITLLAFIGVNRLTAFFTVSHAHQQHHILTIFLLVWTSSIYIVSMANNKYQWSARCRLIRRIHYVLAFNVLSVFYLSSASMCFPLFASMQPAPLYTTQWIDLSLSLRRCVLTQARCIWVSNRAACCKPIIVICLWDPRLSASSFYFLPLLMQQLIQLQNFFRFFSHDFRLSKN